MTAISFSQRLEILFWKAAIALMGDRKVHRIMLSSVLVLLILVVIFSLAIPAFGGGSGKAAPFVKPTIVLTPTPDHPSIGANGQRNILLILVNSLEEQSPLLEGVWLAIYMPSGTPMTLLPLYPGGVDGTSSQDAFLESVFRLSPERAVDPAFFNAIQDKGVWWSNYIIIDNTVLAKLVDLSGGIDRGSKHLDGQQVIASLAGNADKPQSAQVEQAFMLQKFCQNKANLAKTLNPDLISSSLADHFQTDIELERMSKGLKNLHALGNSYACEFPTLTVSATSNIP